MSDERFSHAVMLDRERKRNVPPLWSASSAKGVVATAHYLATEAGVGALERGGNAIDAAVAASLALAVCEPAGSGLGGMAMMLIHSAGSGRTFAISGACRAPGGATPEVVSSSHRYRGYRAVAVPTHLAVMRHVSKRYGRLKPGQLAESAIRLADGGFPVSELQHRVAMQYVKHLRKGTASSFFLDAGGAPLAPGTELRQPTLAKTLRRLVSAGFEDYYVGGVASEIADDMEAHGGFVTTEDLSRALAVEESAPLKTTFWGDDVLTLGPPAGGLSLLQMLRMASFVDPEELDMTSGEGVSRVAAIISRARRDRKKYRLRTLANGVGEAAELLEDEHARRAAKAALERVGAGGVVARDAAFGEGETTHICVIDASGSVVSLTQSIERSFGAAVATRSLGFLYNGYLRAFKVQNEKHPHYLRPGAPARSNAAPTIVLRQGRPFACLGSTGSERMLSGIFEVLLRLRHDSPFDAVHAPRLHCTPDRHVLWEEQRFPRGFRESLLAHGFTVEALDPYSFQMGGLQLAVRQGGQCIGVAEPRRDGAAACPLHVSA